MERMVVSPENVNDVTRRSSSFPYPEKNTIPVRVGFSLNDKDLDEV
jgi:hypothetical protein